MAVESQTRVAPDVARQAVHWLLELQGDGSAPQSRQRAWQDWLAQDPAHALAWARIAEVDGQLRGVPPAVALRTLAAPGLGRRQAAKLGLLLAAGTGGLLVARQTDRWSQWTADLGTTTGERRATTLADGTQLWLNTATAVDLRYGVAERRLQLRAGEILVATAPDTAATPRPFLVDTADGRVCAMGTRFVVRQHADHSAVAVLGGAVELRPLQGGVLRLEAGQSSRFTRAEVSAAEPLREAASAWREGMLVVDNEPLDAFVAELARHRPGVLRCAPDAASLRVSGSYPLADTDRVLAALARTLPVQIEARTRWWIVVTRRAA